MSPLPYFEADRLLELREKMAIKIQAQIRAFFARREAHRLREAAYNDYMARIKAQQDAKAQDEERRRKEIARRMHPRTREDFDLLYSELHGEICCRNAASML